MVKKKTKKMAGVPPENWFVPLRYICTAFVAVAVIREASAPPPNHRIDRIIIQQDTPSCILCL